MKKTLNRISNCTKIVSALVFTAQQLICGMPGLAQTEDTCHTAILNLSTGYDHMSASVYPWSVPLAPVQDNYWQLTRVPANDNGITVPRCAEVYDAQFLTDYPEFAPYPATQWISFRSLAIPEAVPGWEFFYRYGFTADGGMPIDDIPPAGITDEPVRLSRKFYIDASTPQEVTFDITGKADDKCFISIDAPADGSIFSSTGPSDANVLYYVPEVADNY